MCIRDRVAAANAGAEENAAAAMRADESLVDVFIILFWRNVFVWTAGAIRFLFFLFFDFVLAVVVQPRCKVRHYFSTMQYILLIIFQYQSLL